MTTYSREYLLTYRQNAQAITLSDTIEKQVLQASLRGQTRVVYPMTKLYNVGNGISISSDDIVNRLRVKFPDSIVEFQEIKNIHGKIESGIVIDWS